MDKGILIEGCKQLLSVTAEVSPHWSIELLQIGIGVAVLIAISYGISRFMDRMADGEW